MSAAGKRSGLKRGTRSGLWHEFARAIGEVRPRLVVIENVRGLLTARGDEPTAAHLAAEATRDAAGHLLHWIDNEHRMATRRGDVDGARRIAARRGRVVGCRKRAVGRARRHERHLVRAIGTVLGTLAELGYDASWCGLRAADVGAPHGRFRIFVVAVDRSAAAARFEGGVGDGDDVRPRRGAVGRGQGAGGGVVGDAEDVVGERGRAVRGLGEGDAGPGRGAGGKAAQDPDVAARGERRQPAPGEEAGGRARADAGGRGGVPDADPVGGGRDRGAPDALGRSVRRGAPAGAGEADRGGPAADADGEGLEGRDAERRAGERAAGPGGVVAGGRRAAADPEGVGRDEGRPEPARLVGGPDAAVGGDAAPSDAGGQRHGGGEVPGRLGRLDRSDAGEARERERARELAGDRGAASPADPDDGPGHGERARPRPRHGGAAAPNPTRDAGAGAEPDDPAPPGRGAAEPGERTRPVAWGPYEPAVRRWERALGRDAPPPTEQGARGGQRLSPRFVEWMMGLPDGWVTDVPGLSRNEQLKALGNGVVPQQAEAALRHLLEVS